MKILILFVLIALSWGLCAAQKPLIENAAPGVTVVESGWRKISVRNPALDEDQITPLENQDRSERIRNEVVRQNAIRAEAGKDQARLPARNAPKPITDPPAHPYEYSYKVKVVNTGVKKIRWLVWEYVLVDPSTGSEVGRHRFVSRVSVRPGKSTMLFGHSTLPPATTVDARNAGGDPRGQYSEHVVIQKIYYDDDTVWERSSSSG